MDIDIQDDQIVINGQGVTLPSTIEALTKAIGVESRKFEKPDSWSDSYVWDDFGIYARADAALEVDLLYVVVDYEKYYDELPKHGFSGKFTVNGVPVDYADETRHITSREYQASRRWEYTHGDEPTPYTAYMILENPLFDATAARKQTSATVYATPPAAANPLVFKDFNFKLAVIQELMYNQGLLTPKVDAYEFAEQFKGRTIDVDTEGYEPIPELVDYFTNVQIDASLADKVTALHQDGGNEVYMAIAPLWGGDDDTFTIQSFEDTALFPELKEMTLLYDDRGDEVLEELKAKGIAADWL